MALMTEMWREPSSFRDPSGHILYARGNVYRSLDRDSYGLVRSLLQSPIYSQLREKELVIETEIVDESTQTVLEREEGLKDRLYIRHRKIEFVSYPYEWSAEMLLDAGLSTLAVQMMALEHGRYWRKRWTGLSDWLLCNRLPTTSLSTPPATGDTG